MASRHLVQHAPEARYEPPGVPLASHSSGYARWSCVDEGSPGAVHTGFEIRALEPAGSVGTVVAAYEQGVYMLDGEVVLQTPDSATLLRPGDYGLVPVGVPHAWRNESASTARWAAMSAPQPRTAHQGDLIAVPPLPPTPPERVDARDPRIRRFGHIEPVNMEPTKQSQENLAQSASMRTALLVYSGISVKMMIDSDLGAVLTTMFMVQYEPDGVAGPHDHPFEETYFFLEGRAEGTFDGVSYELGPGDVAFAGVGCVHSFRNLGSGSGEAGGGSGEAGGGSGEAGGGVLRWLETQAPQPPARHSYRFRRDWDYLTATLEGGGA